METSGSSPTHPHIGVGGHRSPRNLEDINAIRGVTNLSERVVDLLELKGVQIPGFGARTWTMGKVGTTSKTPPEGKEQQTANTKIAAHRILNIGNHSRPK